MGHANHESLKKMVQDGSVTGIELNMESKPDPCPTCIKAKASCKPFLKESKKGKIKEYGSKVCADVWGPAQVQLLGGKWYSICYQDAFSHEEKIYFLKQKSESFATYRKYKAWIKVQRDANIKIFGTDQGEEFMSAEFNEHLENAGTIRHLTIHDSPQSNRKSERSNQTHLNAT
jgi:hypothetical protein